MSFGINVADLATLTDWAEDLSLVDLVLLSDHDPLGDVAQMLGIMNPGASFAKRANVLIDESGVLVWRKTYTGLPDFQEILDWIDDN